MPKGKKKGKKEKAPQNQVKRKGKQYVTLMPECELCGETEDKVYKCKVCGTRFCEHCGSPEDKLCIDCLDEEEYDEEDYEGEPLLELIEDNSSPRPHIRYLIDSFLFEPPFGGEFP